MDMSHTISTDTGLCYFDTTLIADNTFIFDFLIFTAVTLPVLTRSKDSFTIQTIFFRF